MPSTDLLARRRGSSPLTTARDGRATVALKPGTLRQPSSSSCMPSRSTNSGLMNVSRSAGLRPTETSHDEDAQRRRRPACAARPMPGAAYIVWIMSSMSCWISAVISATGAAGCVQDVGAVAEDRTDHRQRRCAARREAARAPARRSRRSGARSRRSSRRRTSRGTRRRARTPPSLRRRRRRPGTAQTSLRSMAAGAFGQRGQVDGAQRLHQRGDRLHEAGDADVLAVGDAAFEAAGVVGGPRAERRRRAPAAGSRRARASRAGWRPPGRCRCRPP